MSVEELEDLLKCAVCLDVFTKPTGLSCGHTFCLECLISVQERAKNAKFPECPLCKQKFRAKKSFYWKQSVLAIALIELLRTKTR